MTRKLKITLILAVLVSMFTITPINETTNAVEDTNTLTPTYVVSDEETDKLLEEITDEDIIEYLNSPEYSIGDTYKNTRGILNSSVNTNYKLADAAGTNWAYWINVYDERGMFAYCIQPGEMMYGGDYTSFDPAYLSAAQKDRIRLLIYYGETEVAANSATTQPFRFATQILIRETITKVDSSVFQVDASGNTISTVNTSDYEAHLERLLVQHYLKPSFVDKSFTVDVGQQTTLADGNGILSKYNVNPSSQYDFTIDGNNLHITAKVEGEISVSLTRKGTKVESLVWWNKSGSQNMASGLLFVPRTESFVLNSTKAYQDFTASATKVSESNDPVPYVSIEFADNIDFNNSEVRHTNSAGVITTPVVFSIEAETATIYAREISAPYEYVVDPTIKSMTVSAGETATFSFVNEFRKIEVTKTEEGTGKLIEGTEFTLYEGVESSRNTSVGGNVVTLSNGVRAIAISTSETDAQGVVLFDRLIGANKTYYLVETKAAEGYVLIDEVIEIDIQDASTTIRSVEVTNEVITSELQIAKIDKDTGEYLAGAKFTISDLDGNLIDTVTTGEDGLAKITLDYGKYIVEEVEAPTGYSLGNYKEEIEVKTHDEVITVTAENEKIKSNLLIAKIDKDTREYLAGAKFTISDLDGNLIDTVTTGENGLAEVVLEFGKYIVEEVEAPTGYNLGNYREEIEVNTDSGIITVTAENEKIRGGIELFKTDSDTGEIVKGAVFGLYKWDEETETYVPFIDSKIAQLVDSEIGELILDYILENDTIIIKNRFTQASEEFLLEDHHFITSYGKIILDNIPFGKYALKEVVSPEGYVINEEFIPFEVSEEKVTISVEAPNKRISSSIKLSKVDGSTGELIGGAQMLIEQYDFDTETWEEFGTYTSLVNEYLVIEDMPYGSYRITEIVAPDGYAISDLEILFDIDEDDVMLEFTYPNYKELTNTGVVNAFGCSLLVLLITAVLGFIARRERRV